MPMCLEWEDGLLTIKGIGPYLCRGVCYYYLCIGSFTPETQNKYNLIFKKPRKNMRKMNVSKQMVY